MKINDELPGRLIVTQVMFRRSRFDGASLTGQVALADSNVLAVRTTTNVDRTSSAVNANVSDVFLLVPVRTTPNVHRARNAVMQCVQTR